MVNIQKILSRYINYYACMPVEIDLPVEDGRHDGAFIPVLFQAVMSSYVNEIKKDNPSLSAESVTESLDFIFKFILNCSVSDVLTYNENSYWGIQYNACEHQSDILARLFWMDASYRLVNDPFLDYIRETNDAGIKIMLTWAMNLEHLQGDKNDQEPSAEHKQ